MIYKKIILLLLLLIPFNSFANESNLTIDKALSIAIKNSPKIKAIKKRIKTQKLLGESERLYINPELEIEVSDFLGTKNYSGFKNSGVALTLSQEIILGGKNNSLEKLTNSEIDKINLELKKEKIELKYQIEKLFTEILTIKEFYKLSLENQKISSEIFKTVKNRKESGAISNLELLNSEIEYKNSEIELSRYKKEINKLKLLLSTLLGDKNLNLNIDENLNLSILEIKNLNLNNINNIDMKIQKAEVENNKRELSVENSNRIPNLTLSLGANRYQELSDYSFTFGVSIPLPIWNSNSKKISSVYSKISKNRIEIEVINKNLKEKLTDDYQNLEITKNELNKLKNEILPLAEKSLKLAKEGYKEGEFKYLELLDSKKRFIKIQKEYIELLSRYNFLQLEIKYITE